MYFVSKSFRVAITLFGIKKSEGNFHLWYLPVFTSLFGCVCAHFVSNRVMFEVSYSAAFMGKACLRTQMHLADPGVFSLSGSLTQTSANCVSQVLTPRSITLKTLVQPLPPRLSQYLWLKHTEVTSKWFVLFLVCCHFKMPIFLCCWRQIILVLHLKLYVFLRSHPRMNSTETQ